MKKALLLFQLLAFVSTPAAGNDAWPLPGEFLGCRSFFAAVTCREDDFAADVEYLWNALGIYRDELRTVYQLEIRQFEKGLIILEPIDWRDEMNAQWAGKYGPVLDAIELPDP